MGRAQRTTRRFVICEECDVVVVPFPFVDRAEAQRRPALVLSKKRFNRNGHTVLAMIHHERSPSVARRPRNKAARAYRIDDALHCSSEIVHFG